MIDKMRIEQEAHHFFEWPDPKRKNHVTLTSCVIFAATVAEMVRAEERERWLRLLEACAESCMRAGQNNGDPVFGAMADILMAARKDGLGPNVRGNRPARGPQE